MLNIFSILLIFFILIFLLIFKRKYILNLLRSRKINEYGLNKRRDYKEYKFINKNNISSYTYLERDLLRKEMFKLFKGSKEDKLKALNIAGQLSDKSTLSILRIGLKDMDSDVVKLSAILINKFK